MTTKYPWRQFNNFSREEADAILTLLRRLDTPATRDLLKDVPPTVRGKFLRIQQDYLRCDQQPTSESTSKR